MKLIKDEDRAAMFKDAPEPEPKPKKAKRKDAPVTGQIIFQPKRIKEDIPKYQPIPRPMRALLGELMEVNTKERNQEIYDHLVKLKYHYKKEALLSELRAQGYKIEPPTKE